MNTAAARRKIIILHGTYDDYAVNLNEKPVGAGAMGVVYKGVGVKTGEKVAVKKIRPEYARIPSVVRRAVNEGSMLFGHSHLIEMRGYHKGPGHDDCFIISKFIDGYPISRHVRDDLSRFPDRVERICREMICVLDGLEYLHQHGIVHLDIKPSNIIVERGNTNVRLMDMGIAFTRETSEITSSGLLGTPGYAAPEQCMVKGSPMQIDSRTDIYGLGVTLYELLAGGLPQDIEKLKPIPGVNGKIMKVLRKAIRRNKEDRYQSATEMRLALEEALRRQRSYSLIFVAVGVAILFVVAVAVFLLKMA